MEKKLNSLTGVLLWFVIASGISFLLNISLLFLNGFTFVIGLATAVVFLLSIYSLTLIKNNNELVVKITVIIGPIMTIISLVEGFMNPIIRFNQTLPVIGWVLIIGGIVMTIKSIKLLKNKIKQY